MATLCSRSVRALAAALAGSLLGAAAMPPVRGTTHPASVPHRLHAPFFVHGRVFAAPAPIVAAADAPAARPSAPPAAPPGGPPAGPPAPAAAAAPGGAVRAASEAAPGDAVGAALVATRPAGVPAPIASPPPAAAGLAAPPGFANLAARLLPAVVNIAATTPPPATRDRGTRDGAPFRKRFSDFMRGSPRTEAPPPRGTQSLGSGFIIDPSGLIVTNHHVIAGATRISVTLQDGTELPAQVVGRDRTGDLALLRVAAGHPLPAVRWGASDAVRVGDWVIAIGNPFGLGGTVTAGIVSARGRDIHDGPYDDFIQTDAPINRGNSGGPLFDLAGRVIGVNTAIYAPSGGSIGIGFAIPSDLARPDVAQLRRYGHPRRGWLGLQAEGVTPALARGLGLPRELPGALPPGDRPPGDLAPRDRPPGDLPHQGGALVASVAPGGPAATAGLQPGDVILRFNGVPLRARTLPRRMAETPPGTIVALQVWRAGQRVSLDVRAGARRGAPPHPPASAHPASPMRPAARSPGSRTPGARTPGAPNHIALTPGAPNQPH